MYFEALVVFISVVIGFLIAYLNDLTKSTKPKSVKLPTAKVSKEKGLTLSTSTESFTTEPASPCPRRRASSIPIDYSFTSEYETHFHYFQHFRENPDKEESCFKMVYFGMSPYNAFKSRYSLTDSRDQYPLFLYGFAGNIGLDQFQEFLLSLRDFVFDLEGSQVLEILIIFGNIGKVELFMNTFSLTEKHIATGLRFAAFYGKYDIFNSLLQSKFFNSYSSTLDKITDNQGNSLLHLVVIGNHCQSNNVEKLFRSLLPPEPCFSENNRKRCVMKESLYCQKVLFISVIFDKYGCFLNAVLYFQELIYTDLQFSHKDIFYVLKDLILSRNELTEFELYELALNSCNDVGNVLVADSIVRIIPLGFDITLWADKHNDPIYPIISLERNFRVWCNWLLGQYTVYIFEYINRPNDSILLAKMSVEDDLPADHYDMPYCITSVQKRNRRAACERLLKNLFTEGREKVFDDLYHHLSETHRSDPSHVKEYIRVDRKQLLRFVVARNDEEFKDIILRGIEGKIRRVISGQQLTKSVQHDSYIYPSDIGDDECPFNEHHQHFIELFIDEFEKSHQLFSCLSRGDLLQKPDTMEILAKAVGDVAIQTLPSVSVPLPVFGVPLPISFSLPSGAVVAAVVNLMLYLRRKGKEDGAQRVGRFFEGKSLIFRVNEMYCCGKFIAFRYFDQISNIDHKQMHVFVGAVVARVFSYTMHSDSHIYSQAPTFIGTILRKVAIHIPEPERLRKPLLTIAIDAFNGKNHNIIFSWEKKTEVQYLNSSEWTAKGIFEHAGMRSPLNEKFVIHGQDYKKYGFYNATEDEVQNRPIWSKAVVS